MSRKRQAHTSRLDAHPGLMGQLVAEGRSRGAILVGGALLDELLADAIAARCVDAETADELLNGREAVAQSFSSRIMLSFALGIITDQERRELHRLKDIRNEAAHFKRHQKGFEYGFEFPSTQDSLETLTIQSHPQVFEELDAPLKAQRLARPEHVRADLAYMRFMGFVTEMGTRLAFRAAVAMGKRPEPFNMAAVLAERLGNDDEAAAPDESSGK